MTISELNQIKKTVIKNRKNLEFSTKISTEDLLRIIELAERTIEAESGPEETKNLFTVVDYSLDAIHT